MRDVPRLSWLNAKAHPSMNGNRKNQSGHATELAEALVENGSSTFEKEVDKALIANLEAQGMNGKEHRIPIEAPTSSC